MIELTQEQQVMATTIIEALVDGLRIHDEELNKKAVLAMVLIGRDLIPAIKEKAQRKQTRSEHRERLLAAARWIETHDKQVGNEGQAVINYLVDALRVSNKKLNEKAADALCGLSPDVVDTIVPVAFVNRKKVGYCLRLLSIVERIDAIPNPMSYQILVLLAQRGNERIQEAVRRVLMSNHLQNWDVLDAWERLGRSDADS